MTVLVILFVDMLIHQDSSILNLQGCKLKKGKKFQNIKVLEKIEMLLLLYYNSNPTNQPNRRFIK